MKERRTYVRVPVGLEFTYQTDRGIVRPRLGMTQDVSGGGMRMCQAERLESGEKVTLSLHLPNEGLVVLHGLVIWCREARNGRDNSYQTGVRWADMNTLAQSRLDSFVANNSFPRRMISMVKTREGPEEVVIVWPRAVVLGFFSFLILATAAYFWIERMDLLSEVEGLRAAVLSYQEQILHLLGF